MFSSASPEFHLHSSAGQFLSTRLTRLSRSSSVCANAADLSSARRLHSFRRHVVPCSLSLALPPWLFARGAGLQFAACPPSPTLHLLPESSFRRCGKHATGVGPLAVPSSWWPQRTRKRSTERRVFPPVTGGHPQAFTQRPAVPLRPSLWAPPGLVAGAVNAPPQLPGHLGGGAVNLHTAGAQPPRRPRLHPPSLTLGSMKGRPDFSLACVDLSPAPSASESEQTSSTCHT